MKNNLPSARFLYEFDTVDTLALRNISEKRKLQRQLGELDKQLHSNLVRMESEILSIRLEKCETSPATKQGKGNVKEGKSNGNKGKTKTQVKESSHGEAKTNSSKVKTNMADFIDGISANQATQHFSSKNTLPKITTSSYLTAKQEQFNENQDGETDMINESFSLETISEMGQKQQQAEQRILMSLQRPRSKLKVQTGSISRPPTPQASNLLLSPLRPIDRQRRASSYGQLAPLPDEYVTKDRLIRAFSAPDVSESLSTSDLGRLRSLAYRQNQTSVTPNEVRRFRSLPNRQKQISGEVKGPVTNENDSSKPDRVAKFKLDPLKTRGSETTGSKTNNFDEVLKSRLQLLENGVPNREDLERIRYLRLKDENENANEVEDIFAVLHQNKNG